MPQSGPIPAGYQFLFNVVGTTGRTSLQTLAVNNLNVRGKATNFTAQRDTTPFAASLSGMKYIRRATFGGNADAVALDVKGPIGKAQFRRGLGDPTGVFNAKIAGAEHRSTGTQRFAVRSRDRVRRARWDRKVIPPTGLQGGVVPGQPDRQVKVGPANYITQTSQNPNFVQLQQNRSPTYYLVNPGTALTNSAITTDGSIDRVQVTGNQLNSEIKTGFDYASYVAGLQGTRIRQPDRPDSPARRPGQQRRLGDRPAPVDSAGQLRLQLPRPNGTGRARSPARPPWPWGMAIYAASFSRHAYPGRGHTTPAAGRPWGTSGPGFFARVQSRQPAAAEPEREPDSVRRLHSEPASEREPSWRRGRLVLDRWPAAAGSPPPEGGAPVQSRAEPGDEQERRRDGCGRCRETSSRAIGIEPAEVLPYRSRFL